LGELGSGKAGGKGWGDEMLGDKNSEGRWRPRNEHRGKLEVQGKSTERRGEGAVRAKKQKVKGPTKKK